MRCRSWRPVMVRGHPYDHHPGTCRTCWRPCFARVERGQTRCENCIDLLAQHPNALIRRFLAQEPDLPEDTAELLSTDFDAVVQNAAAWRLERIAADRPSAIAGHGS